MSVKVQSHISMDPEKHTIETSSLGSDSSAPQVDPSMEKVVWRKLDLWLLPTVAMFYLLSFLVREYQIILYCLLLTPCFLHRIGQILGMLESLGCKNN